MLTGEAAPDEGEDPRGERGARSRHPAGRRRPSVTDDLLASASAAKQVELARAAELAAEAAAAGLSTEAVMGPTSVRPLRELRPVPGAPGRSRRTASTGPNRRASDHGLSQPLAGPAYDPYTARRRRAPEWLVTFTTALVAGDVVAAALAVCLAAVATSWSVTLSLPVVAAILTWPAALGLFGAYAERRMGTGPDEYRRVLLSGLALVAALGAVAAAVPTVDVAPLLLVAVPAATVLTALGRNVQRRRLHRARREGRMAKRVVVVGREVALVDLVRRLRRDTDAGWQVLGACVPDPGNAGGLQRDRIQVLGGLDHVTAVLDNVGADAVIVASASETAAVYLRELAWKLEGTNIEVLVVPGLIEVAPDRLHIRPTMSVPLIQVSEPEFRGLRRLVKSVVDRTAALVALLLGLPLLLVLAVLVKRSSPGPVFYRHRRIGKRGREFDLLKFRSMVVDADRHLENLVTFSDGNDVQFKMRKDPRITGIGAFLRRTSLDELPQLINVLKGDMSLVGPRPHVTREVEQYGDDMHRRLLVKPGITGLWQVSGRSDLSWDESVELDVRYVENWSLGRDLAILWRTARAVARGSGAY